jgi:hypothetical protein
VAVANGGKDRFLKNSPDQLAALLQAGIAVCLPDVRGTGETSFTPREQQYGGVVQRHLDLSRNLLGSRLKDLRTVVHWLRSHRDLGHAKVAVWGESFAPPNPANLYLDEVEYEAGPRIQRQADPLGAHLALLAGLYEEDVQAVVARGGLYAYLSVLENAYTYVPMEVTVLGILKSGDVADIVGAMAPRPVALANLVGGRNIRATEGELDKTFAAARDSYEESNAVDRLDINGDVEGPAVWIITNLK